MAGRDPDAWLDAAQVRRILAPLADIPSDLAIRVEDASGALVAIAGQVAGASDAQFSRELRIDDALIGRLVAEGGAIADPAVVATVEALALGLEALADARRRSGASNDPSGDAPDRPVVVRGRPGDEPAAAADDRLAAGAARRGL